MLHKFFDSANTPQQLEVHCHNLKENTVMDFQVDAVFFIQINTLTELTPFIDI